MSAEAIEPLLIDESTRFTREEMDVAERAEGLLATRIENARAMLDEFFDNGTPENVKERLSLSDKAFFTAIDDAQSLYDRRSLHVIPLSATLPDESYPEEEQQQPIISPIAELSLPDIEVETLIKMTPPALEVTTDEPELLTKNQLVDVFSRAGDNPEELRTSLARLLSLNKEGGTSQAKKAADFLKEALFQVAGVDAATPNELPKGLFTGETFSFEQRKRLFQLIGIQADRDNTGTYCVRKKDLLVLDDIRRYADSGKNNPNEAEAAVVTALNIIADQLGLK